MKPQPKSPRIRVRAATAADLDALMDLEQRVFATDRLSRRSLRRLLASPTARVIVAETSGRLAGAAVVLFRRGAAVARLYSIAVAPQMSGQGVGAALLVAGRAGGRRPQVPLHASRSAPIATRAAISRYRKSGYRQFGRHACLLRGRRRRAAVREAARVLVERDPGERVTPVTRACRGWYPRPLTPARESALMSPGEFADVAFVRVSGYHLRAGGVPLGIRLRSRQRHVFMHDPAAIRDDHGNGGCA